MLAKERLAGLRGVASNTTFNAAQPEKRSIESKRLGLSRGLAGGFLTSLSILYYPSMMS